MKKLLCTVAASLVAGLVVVAPSTPAEARGSMNIRVGTFNVLTVSMDTTDGNRRPWRDRRGTIIRQVLDERLDVLGAQEINQGKYFRARLVDGITQMTDLRNGLNKAGGTYALTNTAGFNCVDPSTNYKCTYRYRAASGDNRILYNTSKLRLVRQGTYKYRNQGSTFTSYLPWATFRTRATGYEFTFASTHLTTTSDSLRRAQWSELIKKMTYLRDHYARPVMVVGDFNAQKFSKIAEIYLPAMRRAGFGDVTGQQAYESRITRPRAQRRINGFINSWNRMDRNVKNYSYYDDRTRMGNTIDYIFASNALAVPEYKLCLNYGSDLQVNGVMPSDHNMLRATITLG
ncbi:endonuclease/exonuclease/phosphatase family protein [Nocardioides marmoribigeumensis]|uniref:Endonuclease/exonuclease/phosphatase family metal-dependent hydrolase n=1 Tax=Nocardioides marmoribigeumensis TaxID=433649 RepID=A0ABU2BTY7_9ACTN|nr:endonuclease/exonuclease/phosphatase family protein [Nocardioides marmoribigeumensis]MDR7361751.1 endonuclease/exonuclease/phosphatase family metal-dependent hydrolase [Nocardioides marmoribigeumensis]